jgi:ankyrin repeat protein
MAAEDNNDSAVIMLVRAGADINRQNKEEKTPLQLVQSAELRRKMTESAAH